MTAPATGTQELAARRSRPASLLRALGPLLALAIIIGLFAVADQWTNGERANFLSVSTARTMAANWCTVFVAALGMTLIVIAGGIDLSAGTAFALCATVLAWTLNVGPAETPWVGQAAVLLCILAGCGCGLLNGLLISTLRVVPFIVTLGTMTLFLGLAKKLASDSTIRPDRLTKVPEYLSNLTSIRQEHLHAGLPWGVWIAAGLALLVAIVLNWTVFSRRVFAIGSNELTARLCGVNVWLTKVQVYAIAGSLFGIAGVYQFSRLSVGSPTSGSGQELKVIAAVVIGGGSLSGGRGSVIGTLMGVAVMATIDTGCIALGLSNPIQDMILGVIIVSAVAIDQLRQRRLA